MIFNFRRMARTNIRVGPVTKRDGTKVLMYYQKTDSSGKTTKEKARLRKQKQRAREKELKEVNSKNNKKNCKKNAKNMKS